MKKAREFILKVFELLKRPEMKILPAHLAFFIVITLIPLIALMATITASLSFSADAISEAIEKSVPSKIADILNGITSGGGINFNIIIFYLSAFLLASNGACSMINASNEIYKFKPKNMIERRIKGIIITFILVGIFLFLILVPIFGSTLYNIIKQISGEGTIVRIIEELAVLLKYPLIIIILFFSTKLMFTITPDEDVPSKTTNKGAIFTSLGWVLSTEIFVFYIEKFSKYDLFYGGISNILVLLLWIYLLSYICVLGMIINASDYKGEFS